MLETQVLSNVMSSFLNSDYLKICNCDKMVSFQRIQSLGCIQTWCFWNIVGGRIETSLECDEKSAVSR